MIEVNIYGLGKMKIRAAIYTVLIFLGNGLFFYMVFLALNQRLEEYAWLKLSIYLLLFLYVLILVLTVHGIGPLANKHRTYLKKKEEIQKSKKKVQPWDKGIE